MKEVQRMTSKNLLVILSFVLALVLLANVDLVQAQNWDYITLFQGQSASVSASQNTPVGSHFVWVTTIGNVSLGASINSVRGATAGFWLITVLGTGTTKPADVAGGFIPWNSGQRAVIDLQRNTNLNFGLVVTTLLITATDGPASYNISVGQ
jgi:hypothetical protein